MDLKRFLKPTKIAIIGASEREGFGGDTCRNAMAYMAKEDYFFINPKRDEIFEQKCYHSISELPEKVDLIVIATPRATVEDLVKEAAANGVAGAVVYASGYGEEGTEEGHAAEESLMKLCKELDFAIMGPNCAGYFNLVDKKYPFAFISENRDRTGSVGVVSQSGQLVYSMMESPNMSFSYGISAGNSKICKMEDYLDFLVDDEDTKVIAMYLEGVKAPEQLVEALKRAALKKKPIVVLKSGRSEKAQAIAASHTGSLSGSDKVFDAVFEKFGVIRVEDLEELMSTARALSVISSLPKTNTIATISLSGGETGICADLAQWAGLEFCDFTKETLDKLNDALPSYATPNNPLDSTATLSYDAEKFAGALEIVMKDPGVGLLGIGYTLLQEITDPSIHYMTKAIEIVCKEPWAKPAVMIPFAENTRNSEYSEKLAALGVPVLPTGTYSFKIMKNIVKFANYKPEDHDFNVILPDATIAPTNAGALTESASKNLVTQYGIECGRFGVATSADEAVKICTEMKIQTAVAKVDSKDILHKSDVGCVKLFLKTEADIRAAYDEIMANAKKHCPDATVEGIQICDMAPKGTEMIIGVNNDPEFGPCVLCGLGGVFVEIFKDTALGLAPLSHKEASKMVHSLKGVKMLQGYRGESKKDIDAFVEAIVNVSKLATEHKDKMRELDINPVFVYEKGICAVDALYIQK